MYICPRCEKKYAEAPVQCEQCKRPLILNQRFRIDTPIQTGPFGEDFDVFDLKAKASVIMREYRVRKDEMAQRQGDIDRYERNLKRLRGMKYEGNKVVIDAFEEVYTNSKCFYTVFDADAWAGLGSELDGLDGGGGGDEALPPVEGRDLDPEMAARLAKLSGADPAPAKAAKSAKSAPAAANDGAMVKAKEGTPAKGGGGAKVAVAVGVVVIIGAIIAAVLLL